MAFIATWLRLSSNKQLTWYRKSARQGKDIAHSQKVLAQRMADKVGAPRACACGNDLHQSMVVNCAGHSCRLTFNATAHGGAPCMHTMHAW